MSAIPPAVAIGDAVIYQQLHDEAVLLDMNTQAYFGLNDVGTRMWQLLVEHGDVEHVIAQLTTIYQADEETIRRDVHALIEKLMTANLLKVKQ